MAAGAVTIENYGTYNLSGTTLNIKDATGLVNTISGAVHLVPSENGQVYLLVSEVAAA